MRVLHGRHGNVAPLEAGIGATFEEVDARHLRQTHQVVHLVYFRLLQQRPVGAVDHQAVAGRVNIVPALVVTLEMQT